MMVERISLDQEEAAYTFGKLLVTKEFKEFDESKHPRNPKGEFTESGGGDGDEESTARTEDSHGLKSDEREKVYSWLGDGYRKLRTDPEFGKILEKLPKVSGKVFRGTRVKQEDLAKLKPGVIYRIEKFSSTSQNRYVADSFLSPAMHEDDKKIPVFFEIEDSGHKIPRVYAEVAGAGDEAEVVLMRGDRYKIKDVTVEPFSEDSSAVLTRVKMSQVHA